MYNSRGRNKEQLFVYIFKNSNLNKQLKKIIYTINIYFFKKLL